MKHNDELDAWLTALRHEMAQACMARACELPEKVMLPDLRRTYCCEQFVPIFAELHDAKRWKNRKTRKAGRKRTD